jgi:hypothetical protein
MTETQPNQPIPHAPPSREQKNNAVFGGSEFAANPTVNVTPAVDDIPYERVKLPSEGKVYAENTTLHNKKELDIRVMTAREEDILTSRALIKKGTVITELLRACIMDKSVDIQEMVAGDRNAIMVAVRISGYGREYPAEIVCNNCGHKFENDFDLGKLTLKKLGIEPVEEGKNLFKFTLPMSKSEVLFKFLTGKDEEEIDIIQTKMKKLGQVVDNLVTTRLKRSIVSIDGNEDKGYIARFVDRMRAGDSKALRRYVDKHEPGVNMKQEAECPACGDREEVHMPLGSSFFWPE